MPRYRLSQDRGYCISNIRDQPKPTDVFEGIIKFLKQDCEDRKEGTISNIGGMIYTYVRPADIRTTTVAITETRVNVTIRIFGNYRFEGFVLTVDEFKLIWERVL